MMLKPSGSKLFCLLERGRDSLFRGCRSRFSQQIRQVLARGEGALEEARRQCDAQMDEGHALLRSDAVFRAECAPDYL